MRLVAAIAIATLACFAFPASASPSGADLQRPPEANPYSGPSTNGFFVRDSEGNLSFVPNGDPRQYDVRWWYLEIYTHDNSRHWGTMSAKTMGELQQKLEEARELDAQVGRYSNYHSKLCYHNVRGPIAYLNWEKAQTEEPADASRERPTDEQASRQPAGDRPGRRRSTGGRSTGSHAPSSPTPAEGQSNAFGAMVGQVHGKEIMDMYNQVMGPVTEGMLRYFTWLQMNKDVLAGTSSRNPASLPQEVGKNMSSYLQLLAENLHGAHQLQMNLQQAHTKATDKIIRDIMRVMSEDAPRLRQGLERFWESWDRYVESQNQPQQQQPQQSQQPPQQQPQTAEVEAKIGRLQKELESLVESNLMGNAPAIADIYRQMANLYRSIGRDDLALGYEEALRDAEQMLH